MSHHDDGAWPWAHTHRRNLAKQLTGLNFASYSRCDGSLWGLNGNAGIGYSSMELRLPPQL